jgi:hypothetical protein
MKSTSTALKEPNRTPTSELVKASAAMPTGRKTNGTIPIKRPQAMIAYRVAG